MVPKGTSPRPTRLHAGGALAFAFVLVASPASAQVQAGLPDSVGVGVMEAHEAAGRATFSRLVVPATLGSLVGSVGGALWGESLGWGGGDDPGLDSALLFGMLGGAAGSATGVWLVGRGEGELSYGSAWAASGLGVVGGLAGAWAFSVVTSGEWDYTGLFVGFSVGQGVVTAEVAALVSKRGEA